MEELLKQLLEETRRTNKLLEAISDQLELDFLQQFVEGEHPDELRKYERDAMRTMAHRRRMDLGLEA